MKSVVLVAVPFTVPTLTFPDVAEAGTLVVSDVVVGEVIAAGVALNSSRFRGPTGSKLVPVTVTAVAVTPLGGERLEMVGALEATTVNALPLVALPVGVVTPMEPVVAVAGTAVTICVDVELVTVAATPLKVTAFRVRNRCSLQLFLIGSQSIPGGWLG
jgi:hypothetical protein